MTLTPPSPPCAHQPYLLSMSTKTILSFTLPSPFSFSSLSLVTQPYSRYSPMHITCLPLVEESNNYLQPGQLYLTSVLFRILHVTRRRARPLAHPSPSRLSFLALAVSTFRIPVTWRGPFRSRSRLLPRRLRVLRHPATNVVFLSPSSPLFPLHSFPLQVQSLPRRTHLCPAPAIQLGAHPR